MDQQPLWLIIGAGACGHFLSVFRSDIRGLYIFLFKKSADKTSRILLSGREEQYDTLTRIHNNAYELLLWLAFRIKRIMMFALLSLAMITILKFFPDLPYRSFLIYIGCLFTGMATSEVQRIATMLNQLHDFERMKRAFETTISESRQRLGLPPFQALSKP